MFSTEFDYSGTVAVHVFLPAKSEHAAVELYLEFVTKQQSKTQCPPPGTCWSEDLVRKRDFLDDKVPLQNRKQSRQKSELIRHSLQERAARHRRQGAHGAQVLPKFLDGSPVPAMPSI